MNAHEIREISPGKRKKSQHQENNVKLSSQKCHKAVLGQLGIFLIFTVKPS